MNGIRVKGVGRSVVLGSRFRTGVLSKGLA